MQSIAANIVFGAKTVSQTGAPNAGAIDQTLGQSSVDLTPNFAFGPLKPRVRLPSHVDNCPLASATAQPSKQAQDQVTGQPAAGVYRWKKRGTITPADTRFPSYNLGGFEQRILRGVTAPIDDPIQRPATGVGGQKPPAGKIFTYQTLEPDLVHAGELIQSDFQVKTDALQANQFPPVAVPNPSNVVSSSVPTTATTTSGPVSVPSPPAGVTAGDPAHGLALTKWTFLNSNGDPVSTFNPSPAILLFPLAEQVFAGLSFQGAGVDPLTGASLVLNGEVIGRDLVDVCGELIQGWLVNATENFNGGRNGTTAPDVFTRTYTYVVSTNLGGVIVREQYDETVGANSAAGSSPAPSPSDGRYELDLTLGQVTPSPLPPNS